MQQLFFAGIVSLGLAAMAQAQTPVYITGSTAFRSAVHTALKNRLNNPKIGFVGTSFTGASQAIFEGDVDGTPVLVKTSWSGSVGGIQTVSLGLTVPFLLDGTNRTTGAGTGSATAGTVANGDNAIPDIAMADNYQIATNFNQPTLTDKRVGVVEFKWVAGADAPAGLNMTPQLAKVLFTGTGSVPLSVLTGVAGDSSINVYATGRDPDSGTRVTALAETGVGVFTQLTQYQPIQDAQSGAVTGQQKWPAGPVNGIQVLEGDGGFSSGSTLAGIMGKPTTGTIGGFYVTYLSVGDAGTAITAGAKEMSYNGVLRGPDSTNTIEGKYTFWGYEHLMYKSTLTGPKKALADGLETQLKTTDAPLKLTQMKVSRQSDGNTVKP